MSSPKVLLGTASNTSSSGSNISSGEMRRRRAGTTTMVTVFEAETGKRLDVELPEGGHEGGGATEALRRKLFGLTGVPAENQILLCGGPPYKPLRSRLPPTSLSVTAVAGSDGASACTSGTGSSSSMSTTTVTTKIFLFDWRTLAPEQQQQQQQQLQQQSQHSSSALQTIGSSVSHLSSLPQDSNITSGRTRENPSSLATTPSVAVAAAPAASGSAAEAAEAAEALVVTAEAAEFLGPAEVSLPTAAEPPPSPLPTAEGSLLLKTIANYERGSMLELNRGQAYLETTRRRLQGGETCAERMQTMINALDAAVSNSLDHWEPLQRAHRGLKERLEEQALRHEGMLQTFEQDVATLGTIPLHPALAAAAAAAAAAASSKNQSSSFVSSIRMDSASEQAPVSSLVGGPAVFAAAAAAAGGGGGVGGGAPPVGGVGAELLGRQQAKGGAGEAGREMTLLDCIPVEREQKLLESCRTSQRRFRQEGENVALKYATIEKGIRQQREDPVATNDAVQELLERTRLLCREQESKCAELQANYSESFDLAKENWTDDDRKRDAINRLTELTIKQGKIVPMMKDNDAKAMAAVIEIARAKAALSAALRRRLREVSRLQTDIGKIQKHQELVGMAWGQKEEQFEHLGKVSRMPAAYDAFLQEVLRQRRYHQDFEAKVTQFCSSMAMLRSAEIVSREAFLRAHLGNLPPVFIEMAPGLRNMPPTFDPGVTTPLRPGELPEVYPEDSGGGVVGEEGGAAEGMSEIAGAGSGGGVGGVGGVGGGGGGDGGGGCTSSVGATGKGADAAAKVKGDGEGEGEGEGGTLQASGAGAGSASVATQTATATAAAAAVEGGAGGGGEEAGVGTPTGGVKPSPTHEETEIAGGGHVVRDGDCDDTCTNNGGDVGGDGSVGVTTDAATESNDASSEREKGMVADPAVEGPRHRNGEEGGEKNREEGSVSQVAALEAENARLAEELAEARATLQQLRVRAPAVARGGETTTTDSTAAAAAVTSGKSEDGGERIRSFSDVVHRGNAGGEERGAVKPRGSGGRRGSSSSSKEATQNQLAAYRAGLSMLVKLTDQQRNTAAAAATAAGATTAEASGANPSASKSTRDRVVEKNSEATPPATAAATDTEVTAVAAAASEEEEEEVVVAASSSSPTTVVPDEQHHRDSSDLSSSPKSALKAGDDVEGIGNVPGGPWGENSPCADAAPSAPTMALAVEGGQEHGVGESEEARATAAAAAEVGSAEDRQGSAVSAAAGKGSAPSSPESPDGREVASRDESPVAAIPAAAASGGVGASGASGANAAPGATGTVAVRPATLRGVERIKRAAEYVATHLRHNHARVESLQAFEALASVPRISMCSFDVQDIALFLPTMVGSPEGSAGGPVFLAFHVNCPNRYLSEESVNTARETLGPSPAFILGKIILVEQHVASEEPNPYNVAPNTVYYVLTAENAG